MPAAKEDTIAEDKPPDGSNGRRSNVEGLSSLWAEIRANAKPLAWMLGIWLVIAAGAYLASRHWWRDELSRSLIGAVALVLCAATAMAIFGVKGPTTLVTVLAALGAVVAVGGGTISVDGLLSDGPPREGAIVNCPPAPPDNSYHGYVAQTDLGYAHLRTEPNLSTGEVLLRYPPGCDLRFDHYCIGEPKIHWRFHVPDLIWFHALGDFRDGYIARADIRAGPGLNGADFDESCPGDDPPPATPEITSPLERELKGPIEITAAAPHAHEVGFAVYYDDIPGEGTSATWHQIGIDVNTSDGISTQWDTRSIPGQSRKRPASLTIAAVACLGLDFPFYDADGRLAAGHRRYTAANRGGREPPPLPPPGDSEKEEEEEGLIACNNQAR